MARFRQKTNTWSGLGTNLQKKIISKIRRPYLVLLPHSSRDSEHPCNHRKTHCHSWPPPLCCSGKGERRCYQKGCWLSSVCVLSLSSFCVVISYKVVFQLWGDGRVAWAHVKHGNWVSLTVNAWKLAALFKTGIPIMIPSFIKCISNRITSSCSVTLPEYSYLFCILIKKQHVFSITGGLIEGSIGLSFTMIHYRLPHFCQVRLLLGWYCGVWTPEKKWHFKLTWLIVLLLRLKLGEGMKDMGEMSVQCILYKSTPSWKSG